MKNIIAALERQIKIEEGKVMKRQMQLANPECFMDEPLQVVIPGYVEELIIAVDILKAADPLINKELQSVT